MPAKPHTIDMSQEPSCAKQYAKPVAAENVITGPDNALENVVVYIAAGVPDEPPPRSPRCWCRRAAATRRTSWRSR